MTGQDSAARSRVVKTVEGIPPEAVAASRSDVVPVPVRTLQPGDVTDDGRTVLRVAPEVGGRLHVRFEDDDTLWRMHRESVVWIRKPT